MDVHLRSAFHPLLGRVRIGASRVRPLSPELHTLDCSVACPGSSIWVDKVPSRDTPTLNLAGHRGDVALGAPQVARNRSRMSSSVTPASARMRRSPEHPLLNAVTSASLLRPAASRLWRISILMSVSASATAPKACRPPTSVSILLTPTSKCGSAVSQLRMGGEAEVTAIPDAAIFSLVMLSPLTLLWQFRGTF
jgi:hypothetical protein